jgi:hypothetical protein
MLKIIVKRIGLVQVLKHPRQFAVAKIGYIFTAWNLRRQTMYIIDNVIIAKLIDHPGSECIIFEIQTS